MSDDNLPFSQGDSTGRAVQFLEATLVPVPLQTQGIVLAYVLVSGLRR